MLQFIASSHKLANHVADRRHTCGQHSHNTIHINPQMHLKRFPKMNHTVAQHMHAVIKLCQNKQHVKAKM